MVAGTGVLMMVRMPVLVQMLVLVLALILVLVLGQTEVVTVWGGAKAAAADAAVSAEVSAAAVAGAGKPPSADAAARAVFGQRVSAARRCSIMDQSWMYCLHLQLKKTVLQMNAMQATISSSSSPQLMSRPPQIQPRLRLPQLPASAVAVLSPLSSSMIGASSHNLASALCIMSLLSTPAHLVDLHVGRKRPGRPM
jgi:hypothetical protein